MIGEQSRDLVFRNRVLAGTRPEAQDFFRARGVCKEIHCGDVLFEDGEPKTHAIFPHEGVISTISEMADGRSVEKASVGYEGMVGFSVIMGGERSLGKSVVQISGEASWVPMEDLDEALDRFHCVREMMLRYAKFHIVELMESVACTSLHTAEQRLSRWLLQAHDRVVGDSFYITQEALGRLLGLRRATANAVCTKLNDSGAISYHRGMITIDSRDILHDHACECYDRIARASLR